MSHTASRAEAREAVQTALDSVAERAREVGKQAAADAVSVRTVAAARGRRARRQAKAELEQARAELKQAKAELERAAKSARAGAKAGKKQARKARDVGRKIGCKGVRRGTRAEQQVEAFGAGALAKAQSGVGTPRKKRGKKKALFGLVLLGGAVVAARKFLSEAAPTEPMPVPPRTAP